MMIQNQIKNLMAEWPSRAAFADDLSVKIDRVHKWAQSGSIPQAYLLLVVKAAKGRGIDLTAEGILKMHQQTKPEVATQ